MLRLFSTLFVFFLLGSSLMGQTSVEYIFPVKRDISLSGSYAELRSTHFHSGVDLRVGGVVGASVHAAADGYISRISVSPGGYGNALYISHPDGLLTLYGHMLDFSSDVQSWVREQQYDKKSFSINLYPTQGQFPVSIGDVIGRAGNSGSSGGPHLHFELRDELTNQALNPLKVLSLDVKDNITPRIQNVSFHSLFNKRGVSQTEMLYSFEGVSREVLEVTDTFYVAVAAVDRQNNTWSRLAVYHYRYYLNDSLVFSFTPADIPYNKGGYINSVLEYPLKVNRGLSAVKSFVEPGCGLTSNIKALNGGLFILRDGKEHIVRIELEDEHGNVAVRNYNVRHAGHERLQENQDKSSRRKIMPWYKLNRYEESGFSITLSPGSLYRTIEFTYDTFVEQGVRYFNIHNKDVPLFSPVLLSVEHNVPKGLEDKVMFVLRGLKRDSYYSKVNSQSGIIKGKISSFGICYIDYDTIPPSVSSHFYDGANLSGRDMLSFTIEDDKSGISDYSVKVDGEWILASHDPKNNLVVVELKEDVINRGGKHEMVIFVSDRKNNVTTLKKEFIW